MALPQVGVFGLGAFGQLMVRHLAPYCQILAYDPSPAAHRFARRHAVTLAPLEAVAACQYVILAAPVSRLKALSEAIAPLVRKGAIILDVGSVKVAPAQWMQDTLPDNVDILCTHPLFGPQSGRTGIHGLEIVLCPVRAPRLMRIRRFLEQALGLKVSVTSPEEHDQALAAVQGLTHLIAKVLSGMEPLPRSLTTRSYDLLMQGVGLVKGDSDELFLAIERDNPYARAVRQRFFAEIAALENRLTPEE